MTDDDTDDAPDRSRLGRLLAALALVGVPLAVVWWPGCREYPPVTSREALTEMKRLYAACNTRDPDRLARAEAGVDALARGGKLTPPEAEAFRSIIETAKAGDWAAAERAGLKFASDQVGRGK